MKSINCYSNKTRFLLILAGLCIIFRLPAQNNPNSLGKIIQKDFATAKGTVTAFFPGEMAVGENISSALIIKPAGKTQQQIQQNRDFFSGNIFKIGSQQVNPKGTCIQFSVPENLQENFLPVEWLDNKMKVLSHTQIPVTSQPLFQLPANMLENFPPTIPTYVESGIPAVIYGPFDGNFANTGLQIAGKDAEILAESPGELFFKGPDEITGTCDVVV
ncbi:MAG: hypothetical protein EOM73_03510, partial [Bacteroidia bacterium]|nr:hypothetical protein [Bacteroidia bacterium]